MKPPRQFEWLWCQCEKYPNEWFHLTFSKARGFFEPITNSKAEPVIGEITHWQYEEPST